jgi:calcineurin-like phosphoesterase family protein
MKYWTSDTHFEHTNVIKYSKRPFSSKEEMNHALITNWNSVVKPEDEIYHLGDISFGALGITNEILSQLNGIKYLIKGNHDVKLDPSIANRFKWIRDYAEVIIKDDTAIKGKQLICMMHYPMLVWNKSHYGSWQLHGHSHGSLPDDPNALRIDVGVDCHNYTPISYEQIKEKMSYKVFKPVDHHGTKR